MSEWETFCDESYYHLWRVRRKNERGFNDGYHLQNGEEAKALVELLNRLERERDEAREIAAVFKEYAQLLGDEINDMAVFASVHGWKSSRIEQGKLLRDKIKQLEGEK